MRFIDYHITSLRSNQISRTCLAPLDLLDDGVGAIEEVDARAVVLCRLAHLWSE